MVTFLTWFSPSPQTFLNPWYEASLVPIFIITLCTGLWAFFTAGGSFRNILKCLSCKRGDGGYQCNMEGFAGGFLSPFRCWGELDTGAGGPRAAGMGEDGSCL